MKTALILLSGGLDSATAAAVAIERGFRATGLSFHYGQRHERELAAARKVAAGLRITKHRIVRLPAEIFSGSSLTGEVPVPKNRSDTEIGSGIPNTYVPARNLIFLSVAAAVAETSGIRDIFIGVNSRDYSGYPDCRPEFIRAFETVANLATRTGVSGERIEIHAPLLTMSKAEIIHLGTALGVDYSLTSSCYDPADDGGACGECDACILRKKGFAECGMADPTSYATRDDGA